MFRKINCYEGGHKHNFVARYCEKPIEEDNIVVPYWSTPEQIRKLIYYKIYLYDICKWCGKVVNKNDECSRQSNNLDKTLAPRRQ